MPSGFPFPMSPLCLPRAFQLPPHSYQTLGQNLYHLQRPKPPVLGVTTLVVVHEFVNAIPAPQRLLRAVSRHIARRTHNLLKNGDALPTTEQSLNLEQV